MNTVKAIAYLTGLAALLLAQGVQARTLEAGQGKAFATPSAAIAAAQPGDTVSVYPGQYFDCAVVTKDNITIQGVGKAEDVVLTDTTCEGKAILVTRAANITVKNMTLQRARVPDENGAGIRGEGPGLVVDGVRFINNQDGILAGDVPGTMTIRNSYFEKNGTCEHSCAHGVYVGHMDKLRIESTVFRETRRAHHIKSRARETEVVNCDIQDGPEGTASYEIEIPNGGGLLVTGTTIVKGPKAENHTAAIILGGEQISQPTPRIVISNNTFRNDMSDGTDFVKNITATPAELSGNKISGRGPVRALEGEGHVTEAR
jgi:hypothetical protein